MWLSFDFLTDEVTAPVKRGRQHTHPTFFVVEFRLFVAFQFLCIISKMVYRFTVRRGASYLLFCLDTPAIKQRNRLIRPIMTEWGGVFQGYWNHWRTSSGGGCLTSTIKTYFLSTHTDIQDRHTNREGYRQPRVWHRFLFYSIVFFRSSLYGCCLELVSHGMRGVGVCVCVSMMV